MIKSIISSLILISSISCGFVINNESFDSAKWKAGGQRDRGRMVYDLKRIGLLNSKSPDEVVELLGPCDSKHDPKDGFLRFRYHIDTNTLIDLDLDVDFDTEIGKVRTVSIGS